MRQKNIQITKFALVILLHKVKEYINQVKMISRKLRKMFLKQVTKMFHK